MKFIQQFIIENYKWLKFSLYCFLAGVVMGAVGYFVVPDLLDEILKVFSEKFGESPELNMNLAVQIFIQNLIASAIALFGGIVFGITPMIILLVNGFLLGFVLMALFTSSQNYFEPFVLFLLGLVPHGLFELPAFIIAASIGLKIGVEWMRTESQNHRFSVFRANVWKGLKFFPFLAVMLFIAALIEVFVSGKLVDKI